ncbi:cell division protein FtsZ [Candidatus Curtissbacteria bacterium RIFCSPHIGHO2_01_FULL_41_44]|uniref:Cell division protein FtsZ n=1 Tax=Candidatus Curtissbacteria bacterium RIFCSPLOWO2_01_FULL_42_50 TaxID=1797730 RepID=A0A1F5H3B4_9BACT|nr:MAG: cell division protein FtsZ [Candidatus Curtissbacteria bacterium RIFCSPHIGHO2_02_FULL_42_58]OGD94558.1 MAG: cell division protein FtsZ [Candidatus Curtissbacteria bacterium RIFCSPHIGHO2_01_FULL_41_44]OGD97942.1 MAG: cell division protein FtsZ [Candidatus Curtissbacteria bacterium RIFCSPHIGHO2_12_FULL_42_33]OGD98591.1 MAG: cell division protein FtsZ [Candidatus Curtissbacteria bacterium RIFCSPLOWO2_01_FULL_42_50]OGE02167.1 MAG: cell division protein FtsZ [Candidatus Curtissbacteria bacte
MLIKPDVNRFAKIKVLGIGGSGTNALNSMISQYQIQGVDFVAINTDQQHLLASQAPTKVQIGDGLTKGLGAGADPEIGKKAAEESIERIKEVITGADMAFLTYGAGGGTGTGAGPIIADLSRKLGILSVAVVTKPFGFEGTRRMIVAEEGIEALRDKVDTLIVIPNQRLLEVVDKNVSLLEAFKLADSILSQGVQGISDIIVMPGLINVDFADVKTVMTSAGTTLMGVGSASGENRASTAARSAIASPLLDSSIDGARGILFNITGGSDMTMNEVDEAAKVITAQADPDAQIIFGAAIDEKLIDQVKVTVIATGFNETRRKFVSLATEDGQIQTESPEATGEQKDQIDEDEFDIPTFLRQIR